MGISTLPKCDRFKRFRLRRFRLLATKASYYEYAGFHREKLEDSITVKAGEKIGVVVEENVIVNEGESFVYENGEWIDF